MCNNHPWRITLSLAVLAIAASACMMPGNTVAAEPMLTPHDEYIAQYRSLRGEGKTEAMEELRRAFLTEAEGYIAAHPNEPEIVQAKLNKALVLGLYGERKDEAADKLFKQILADYPESELVPEVMYQNARLLLYAFDNQRHDEKRAIELELARRFPRSPRAPFALVAAAQSFASDAGDSEKAVDLLSRVLKEYPRTAAELDARAALIEVAVAQDDILSAQEHVDAHIERFAEAPQMAPPHRWVEVATLRIGYVCMRIEEWERARTVFEMTIAAYPDEPLSWRTRCERARCLEHEKRKDEALAVYRAVADAWLSDDRGPGPELIANAVAMALQGIERVTRQPDADRVELFLDRYRHTRAAINFITGAARRWFDAGDVDDALAFNERLLDLPASDAVRRYLENVDSYWPARDTIALWQRPRASKLLNRLLSGARYWPSARKDRLRRTAVCWYQVDCVFDELAALRGYYVANNDEQRAVQVDLLQAYAAVEKHRNERARELAAQLAESGADESIRRDAQLLRLFARYELGEDVTEELSQLGASTEDPFEKAVFELLLGAHHYTNLQLEQAALHFRNAQSLTENADVATIAARHLEAIKNAEESGRLIELQDADSNG